ncbi:hypothetical protein BX666DRAFT_1875776 [Dichotomocladium elegans]|nr:hypothetical protein BX666DRAFT_1875776 [Dichotomocladium elegans]
MWSRLSPPGDDILPRVFHTAVLGKDNRSIYIFGGLEINQLTNETSNRDYYALSYASFAEIPSYDTVNNSWNLTRVTGDIVPSARYLHTTSVVGSGEIVLYGGIYVSLNFSDINSTHSSLDYFYIFDTDRMAWRNTTLNTTHDAGPGPIHAHSAVYAGNDTLFILFGVSPRSFISGFSILDTKQWAWTTTFGGIHPTPVSNATSSPTASVGDVSGGSDGGGLSPGGIAGVVVGVIAGVAIIGVAGFFLLRARRKPAADIVDPQAPMSHSKMSDSLTSPPLSPTLQQHSSQGRTSFTLENQPTSRNSAYVAGKPDVHYSNANNADNTYVPHLRLEPVKPEE